MINRDDLLSGTRPEVQNRVLITVMHKFEGYQVMDYKGMVWGISMRVKDLGQDYLMGCKQVTGGELTSFTELSDETRQRAVDRMVDMARRIGANAIINFKFEQRLGDATGGAEVTAFGNAVMIKPIKNYVPTGGLGNILAEFVDIVGSGAVHTPIVKPQSSKDEHANTAPSKTEQASNNRPQPSLDTAVSAKFVTENSILYAVCPICGMKYGTEITPDKKIQIRNFADEDLQEAGQQIHCVKCGQKLTIAHNM